MRRWRSIGKPCASIRATPRHAGRSARSGQQPPKGRHEQARLDTAKDHACPAADGALDPACDQPRPAQLHRDAFRPYLLLLSDGHGPVLVALRERFRTTLEAELD